MPGAIIRARFGGGEAREGGPSYEGRIIRRGGQSPEGM
jgi:hypothetical protein